MAQPNKPNFGVRRPPKRVDPAEAEKYLERQERKALGEDLLPSALLPADAALTVPSGDSNVIVRKRDGKVQRRTTVYLPPELQSRLAIFCARTKRRHSDIMTAALQRYLDTEDGGES